ncbi:MAG: Segregation and condensation protein B [Chlamydiae bacterium]|nr:Segregation and condensation protein B [Chlamydiota bacterium]
MTDQTHPIKQVLEALFFASNSPLSLKKIQAILKDEFELDKKKLREEVAHLQEDYSSEGRAFEIKEIAEGYILQSKPEFETYLQKLYPTKAIKLAPSSLEVLAIVAYRQPITRAEIEHIRGVDCSYSLTQLLERQLVSNQNKLDAPGQPSLFETTPFFLEYFGLKNLKELPKLPDDELTTTPNAQQTLPDPVPIPE